MFLRQSALSVPLRILLISPLIWCTMSSDSFELGGDGERTPGVEPVSDKDSFEIGGAPGLSSNSESDIEMQTAGTRADWRRGQRNRGRTPQQFAGSFWCVLVQKTAEGGRQIFGVAQLDWAFVQLFLLY